MSEATKKTNTREMVSDGIKQETMGTDSPVMKFSMERTDTMLMNNEFHVLEDSPAKMDKLKTSVPSSQPQSIEEETVDIILDKQKTFEIKLESP
jgi:hypothetical protein